MTKYNILLFDADDTILDFKKGEKAALTELFKEMNLVDEENIMDVYIKMNESLWKDIETGKLTRDEVLNNRFALLFKKYNKEVDGREIEKRYRSFLNMQHECVEGAEELLESIYKKYKLYIITNGVSKTQFTRLKESKMDKYFEKVFVSEDLGYQKPKKEFFEGVIKQVPNFDLKTTLIIGDSLTADIRGGYQLGIDTCWFNPHLKKNITDVKPTYEIHKLCELHNILKLK